MSVRHMDYVRKTSKAKGTARHVLFELAGYANDGNDTAVPAVKTIALSTGYSESTVRAALRKLEKDKEITTVPGAGMSGSNSYRLPSPDIHQLALLDGGRSSHTDYRPPPAITPHRNPAPKDVPSSSTSEVRTLGGRESVPPTDSRWTPPESGGSPPADLNALLTEAENLWVSERKKLCQRRGKAFSAFTDPQAIYGLRQTASRARWMGIEWRDIKAGILEKASDLAANTWYVHEWAAEQKAKREERESEERKAAERRADRETPPDPLVAELVRAARKSLAAAPEVMEGVA